MLWQPRDSCRILAELSELLTELDGFPSYAVVEL